MCKSLSLSLIFLLANALTAPLAAARQDAQQQQQQQAQEAPARLSNKDVTDMLKAGLAPEIVVAKIKSSPASFDTSAATLKELKDAGVPDAVILAMVEAPAQGAARTAVISAAAVPVEVSVPDGTSVEVELNETISSEHLKEGTIVDFTVVQPVVVNGVAVIAKGAPAKARVTKAKKAGYWGRSGKLEWAMQNVVGADGSRLALRFAGGEKGSASTGKVATGVAVTAVIFFPAAPLWGFKKGKNAVIPAGQRYQVAVHGDAVVKGIPSNEPPAKAAAVKTAETKP